MAQQLSKQDHYDFGLRPIRSALRRAGQLKRSDNSGLSEQAILIQAIIDMTVPKTVPQDLDLVFALIKDLFPDSEYLEVRDVKMICRIKTQPKRLSPRRSVNSLVLLFRENLNISCKLWSM